MEIFHFACNRELNNLVKGAGYSDGLRQTKTKAAAMVTMASQKLLKLGPYNVGYIQWHSRAVLELFMDISICHYFYNGHYLGLENQFFGHFRFLRSQLLLI